MKSLAPVLAATLFLAACGTTYKATILPQQNNTYSAIASAGDRKEALEQAAGKAGQVCQDQKKRLVVLDREETSTGEGDDTVTQITKAVAGKFLGMRNDTAHSVTLLFRCE